MIKRWEDFPRRTDRVALVGFAEGTRNLVPWDDPELEIFSLNEGYNFPWLKQWNRWMQIHPRWDFTRKNNFNDPNHWLWLQNISGTCILCNGAGQYIPPSGVDTPCPGCNATGQYKPPLTRAADFPIYMQNVHEDIPNSVKYPIEEITKAFIPNLGYKYFTSSFSFMLGLSLLLGYKRIEVYGFEMGTQSEYHYQRAGAEYWMGIAHGLGIDIWVPEASTLLKGELYGYKSMRMGYRQQLEMRKHLLTGQLKKAENNKLILEGETGILKELSKNSKKVTKLLDEKTAALHSATGLVNIVRGAIRETENLIDMYDKYFMTGTEGGDNLGDEINAEIQKFVSVEYKVG